jgi:hypothetical protein
VTSGAQHADHRRRHSRFIIYRQHTKWQSTVELDDAGLDSCMVEGSSAGNVMRKVAPWPGLDTTRISAPCCSRMPKTIDRPSPVPDPPFVVQNGSNTRAWTSGLMLYTGVDDFDNCSITC